MGMGVSGFRLIEGPLARTLVGGVSLGLGSCLTWAGSLFPWWQVGRTGWSVFQLTLPSHPGLRLGARPVPCLCTHGSANFRSPRIWAFGWGGWRGREGTLCSLRSCTSWTASVCVCACACAWGSQEATGGVGCRLMRRTGGGGAALQ